MRVLAAVLTLALASPLRAGEGPLPDLQAFLAEARKHLATDYALQSQYTYLERRAELKLSAFAKVSAGPVKTFQVYPGDGRVGTYRRLIAVDGRPVPPAELDKQDRARQKAVLEILARRERESPAERQKRLERREKRRRDEQSTIDDVFRVMEFRMVGRDTVGGVPVIAIDFAPRPGVRPATDNGKLMMKTRGRAFISEADYQVARVQVEMLEDLSVGLVLGKLYRGTTASFERRKVNDEIWLPAEARFHGSGRALVRKFTLDQVVQFSDYRKFSVDTDTSFALPKK
jgi:hypothetical protein